VLIASENSSAPRQPPLSACASWQADARGADSVAGRHGQTLCVRFLRATVWLRREAVRVLSRRATTCSTGQGG
jgi:hypothetical protein